MRFIRQFAGGILVAELIVASVLMVGLMVPLPGHVSFKIVQSGSMVPALPVGSVVTVVPQATYRVGDIITFGGDDGKRIPTTHRIESITREGGATRYVTKGDANEERDNGITAYDKVIGKVVYTVPRLGYMLDFARSRKGFTYTVVIPAGLIILDELLTIYGAVRGRRRDELYGYENGDAVTGNESPVPRYQYQVPHVFQTPTSRLQPRVPFDGIQVVRRSAPRPQSTLGERVRAGIDGYTVILKAA
jgi:signal peptidase I